MCFLSIIIFLHVSSLFVILSLLRFCPSANSKSSKRPQKHKETQCHMRDTIRITHENTASYSLIRKVVPEVSIFLYKKILYQTLLSLLHPQNILVAVYTLLLYHLSIPESVPYKGRMMYLHLQTNHDNEYQTLSQM